MKIRAQVLAPWLILTASGCASCASSSRPVQAPAPSPSARPAARLSPTGKPTPKRVAEDIGEWRDIELSRDKRTLAIGTLFNSGGPLGGWVLRRDARNGKLLSRWRVPGGVADLALSRDQTRLATVCAGRVMLWAWPSGRLLRQSTVEAASPMRCDFSPDGKTLAVASGDLLLFDVGSWKPKPRLTLPDPPFVVGAFFSPEGRRLVTAHADIEVGFLLWDLSTRRSRDLSGGSAGRMTFSPNGRLIAAATYLDASLYDGRSGRRLKVLQRADSASSRDYTSFPLAFSPDSRFLLARSSDTNRLEIWSARSGSRIRVLPAISGTVFWIEPRALLVCSRDSVRRVALDF